MNQEHRASEAGNRIKSVEGFDSDQQEECCVLATLRTQCLKIKT